MYRIKYITILKLFFLFLLWFAPSAGQAQVQNKMLLVGITGNKPFVLDTLSPSGISIEIWTTLAQVLNLDYKTQYFSDPNQALKALEQGHIDVLIGPLNITSQRASKVTFSQPYFQASISILSLKKDPSLWQRVKPFFSEKFLYAVIIFISILAIVGTLLWLVERKQNPDQFPSKPARDIGNGMWCAISTMTTAGFGDIVPITFWGRFLTGTWMVISLIMATSMVAGIASTLTLTGMKSITITEAEQLSGKKTGVISGTPSYDFCKRYGAQLVKINNIEDGYQLLNNGKIDAVVNDRTQLQYFIHQKNITNASLSITEYERHGYGFAFRPNEPITHSVNVELLNLQENGVIDDIILKWLNIKHGQPK